MSLSRLDDDVTFEHRDHSVFADAIALSACLVAAAMVHFHAPGERAIEFSAAKTPHALIAHHPGHVRKV